MLGYDGEAGSVPATIGGHCAECQGKGYVTLLVSHARCSACGGTGRSAREVDQHVATIGLSIRAIQGLAGMGVRTVRQAARLSDRELAAAPGVDGAALETLRKAMRRLGIRPSAVGDLSLHRAGW